MHGEIQRKIEGSDGGDNSQRLPYRHGPAAFADGGGFHGNHFSPQMAGRVRGSKQSLHGAVNFHPPFPDGLSAFAGNQVGKLGSVALQQPPHAVEQLGAFVLRQLRHVRRARLGRGYRAVSRRGIGIVNLSYRRAIVRQRDGAQRGRAHPLAADQHREFLLLDQCGVHTSSSFPGGNSSLGINNHLVPAGSSHHLDGLRNLG